MSETRLVYEPSIFECRTETDARAIILTPEGGISSEERWDKETPWLASRLVFPPDVLVLDYGCGIGRVAKEFTANPVLGIDISQSMRLMADCYVNRNNFVATTPWMLHEMVRCGLRAGGAIAVWCLQHAIDPKTDIGLIHAALTPGASFYVLGRGRYIPTSRGDEFVWANDGQDIASLLVENGFKEMTSEPMPDGLCVPDAVFSLFMRQ